MSRKPTTSTTATTPWGENGEVDLFASGWGWDERVLFGFHVMPTIDFSNFRICQAALVRAYVARYKPLLPLVLVLKQHLIQHALHESYTGEVPCCALGAVLTRVIHCQHVVAFVQIFPQVASVATRLSC